MGDIANMTDCDGRVNGSRLLRWLRSRADIAETMGRLLPRGGESFAAGWHAGRADLVTQMADDLERELTPPDYPEADGEGVDLDDKSLVDRPETE